MLEAKYEIRLSESTNCFHYDVWLELDGQRVGRRKSGCSIAPHFLNWNFKSCRSQARYQCKELLREWRSGKLKEPGVVERGVIR